MHFEPLDISKENFEVRKKSKKWTEDRPNDAILPALRAHSLFVVVSQR